MKYTYLVLAMCLLICSCQRDEMDVATNTEVVVGEPMVKVEGSVIGFVVNEQGDPIADAIVSLGDVVQTTNEFGSFALIDQELYADGTYLTVEKPGYFPGSRRFNAIADEQNNIRVRLIDKNLIGDISSDIGGSVGFSAAEITLPSGNYSTDDGSSYSGSVSVYAKYLDPTKDATFEEMPGDLIGTDSEGTLNALATFGMMAVELENDNGQKLNLPEGETAILKMPVPDELIAAAPATIPLWHFDEERGMWLEEGEANLENGFYVGEVSHFSYWNCDYPLPVIDINGQVSLNGSFVDGFKVQVTDQITGFVGCGYTASRGFFSGGVPANNVLTLRVLDPCGGVIYEDEIGPFTDDTELDMIGIFTNLDNVMLYGMVTNCTGEPMSESAVVFDFGPTSMTVLCEDDGSFNFVTPPCLNGEVDVYGIDISNSLVSPVAVINFSDSENVGTLIACETYIEEGLIIDYDNINWGSMGSFQDSSLVGYSVGTEIFINGDDTDYIVTFTMIDWTLYDPNDGLLQYIGTYSFSEGDNIAQLEGEFQSQGFSVSGTATYEEINQAGQKYLRLNYSTTDVQEEDANLFPGDVGEVEIYLTFPIN